MFTPGNTANTELEFKTSNSNIVSVDKNGILTANKVGSTKLTVTVLSNPDLNIEFVINVVIPDQFEVSYDSESYTTIGESIALNAVYHQGDEEITEFKWASAKSSVATVDENGIVTGVSEGTTTIRVYLASDSSIYYDFTVTILPVELAAELQEIVEAHQSNVFVKYHLGIGSGTPAYYADIVGSVSSILYNKDFYVDEKYLATSTATGTYNTNEVANGGLEFITVHYTGNMGKGADTDNNASYFANSGSVSIHYVTGNEGKYSDGSPSSAIYKLLDHSHGAYHAGDSAAKAGNSNCIDPVTGGMWSGVGSFKWYPTGVAYDGTPLLEVEFSASDDFYYEINGKKTSIKLPTTYNFKSRNTDHIYNSDGTISSQSDFSGTAFSKRTPESFFNDQGLPITVKNGEYYMGTTWWSYGQVTEGRICGVGGNRNSIGIESCVDLGSDLWYTWQITAQLVANLMYENNLDISRVKGHHFFDGKDCPQPMLENDLEIWWLFLELVQSEYDKLTKLSNYDVEMSVLSGTELVNEYGRVEQGLYSEVVTYKVTLTDKTTGEEKEVILSSIIEGKYFK